MQIAAYVDKDYNITDMDMEGSVVLFEKSEKGWRDIMSVRCSISEAANMEQLHKILKDMAEALGECRILVTGEIAGVPNAVLETAGMRMWVSRGSIFNELDYIADKEDEAAKVKEGSSPFPVLMGSTCEGRYLINLKKVLKENPGTNSRNILIPFITGTAFRSLEIICDHPPKWLSSEKNELKIAVQSQSLDKQGLRIVVVPTVSGGGCSSGCASGTCGKKGE